jgi:uncharacterized membrane protein (DUF2068 family)
MMREGARSDLILRLIAVMKLVKGTLLLLVGVGALSLVDGAFERDARAWLDQLQPSHHYLRHGVGRLLALDPHTLEMIAFGTLVYAALFFVEGIGLFLRKVWAEYVTTCITTSFIPVEIYELAHHFTATKVIVIVLNIAIVGYLVWRLRRDHHWPFRSR